MCSGKSTLGRAVSLLAGVPFVDLDRAVERRAGISIRDIFAAQGEEAFRRLERQLLEEICQKGGGVIVSTGGGLPCQPGAMDEMRAAGLTVWLQSSTDRLINRLMDGRERRPLLAGIETREDMLAFSNAMLAEREPFYSQAHERFDSTYLETDMEITMTAALFAQRYIPDFILPQKTN